MIRPMMLATICGALACGFATGDEDPVEKKLGAAKRAFADAAEKARDNLVGEFQKAEKAAQGAGDLKRLEQVHKEFKAFDRNGELPKSVPTKVYEGELRKARAKLEDSYDAAVKEYTKDGKIALAKATQKEFDEFKKSETSANVEKWEPLFNGRDKKNWQPTLGATTWAVTGGALVGTGSGKVGAGSLLYVKGEMDNFRIRVKAIAGPGRMVMLRSVKAQGLEEHEGYTVTLDPADGEIGTLAVFVPGKGTRTLAVAAKSEVKAKSVVTLDISAQDNVFIVRVDGKEVVNFTEPNKSYPKGFLGLRCGRNDSITVKSIELLKPEVQDK